MTVAGCHQIKIQLINGLMDTFRRNCFVDELLRLINLQRRGTPVAENYPL